MEIIKIFIASSLDEFRQERLELADMEAQLNRIYIEKGIRFEFIMAEHFSNEINVDSRKQDEFNKEIPESQLFYILAGRHIGAYTLEEFDNALASLKERGKPVVVPFFLKTDADESVINFRERLDKELGHFYSFFSSIDTVKFNIMLNLARHVPAIGNVSIENGKALLNGNLVLSLENVPIYGQNSDIRELIEEKSELDEDFVDLTEDYAARPTDSRRRRLEELNARRKKVADDLRKMEEALLSLCNQLYGRDSGEMNWRERQAIRSIEVGDYDAAISLLRDPLWKDELQNAEKNVEAALKPIHQYIAGKYTLINTTIANCIMDRNAALNICGLYDEIIALAGKYNVECQLTAEYIEILEYVANSIYHDGKGVLFNSYRAVFFYRVNMGWTLEDAAVLLRKAIDLRNGLSATDPDNLSCISIDLFALSAILFKHLRRNAEALEVIREAVDRLLFISRISDQYNIMIAVDLKVYSIFMRQLGYDEEAENLERISLEMM